MSAMKKYAGLPDLDMGTEIYESVLPDLTEGSTADQSSTLRTESPTPSENGNPNLIRYGLDRELARRRFEPTTVDARGANFSDTVAGTRRDYKTGHRRRRRRRVLENGDEEYEYRSEESEEEETLQSRLARLRREAEEVKAEIARLENEDLTEDAKHQNETGQQTAGRDEELIEGIDKLEKVLDGLSISGRKETLEDEFLKTLDGDPGRQPTNDGAPQNIDQSSQASTISAIGVFGDRLTALESVLGISSIPSSEQSVAIIPTLETLSSQIEVLASTLVPPPDVSSSAMSASQTVHLEPVAERLRILISESKRLEDSRKSAAKSLEELLETRDRHSHFLQSSSASQQQSGSKQQQQPQQQDRSDETSRGRENTNQLTSKLFLDEHANKISALYNLLPTIQSLQPLLPMVLERLRALSVIHAGAADAKSEMEELENRLTQWEKDLSKWREAVEGVDQGMQDNRKVMKENLAVVGGMVKGLEDRLMSLQKQ